MGLIIVYQVPGQPVSIINPCQCGLSVEQIGQKDVPMNVPFWIVGSEKLPRSRELRDSWVLDVSSMGEPAGNGGTYKAGDE